MDVFAGSSRCTGRRWWLDVRFFDWRDFAGVPLFLHSPLIQSVNGIMQVTHFSTEKKCIVPESALHEYSDTKRIAGFSLLSNEMVNVVSVVITTLCGGLFGPLLFTARQ
jgi:hypothetical protein